MSRWRRLTDPQKGVAITVIAAVAVVVYSIGSAVGGGSGADPGPVVDSGQAAQVDETAVKRPPSPCREPSGLEKGSLRFRVRAHDRELKDEPWTLVRRKGVNYMTAEIDAPDIDLSVPLTVLVSFPQDGKYLAGMKAINGTARTFTDLPAGGSAVPVGGRQALDCIDEE